MLAAAVLLCLSSAGADPAPAGGKVLILASADMLKNEFLIQGEEYAPNTAFFIQAVEALCRDRPPSSPRARPRVVFFDGRRPPPQPGKPSVSEYAGVIQEMKGRFEVEEIALRENDSLVDVEKRLEADRKKEEDDRPREEKPDRISCLVVAQPHDLEERQVYEIAKAVAEGIPAVFLVSYHTLDVSEAGLKAGFPLAELRPQLEGLFFDWGVAMDTGVLASRSCASLPLPKEVTLGKKKQTIRSPQPLPVLPRASGEDLDQAHPAMKGISQLVFPAAVPLAMSEAGGRKPALKATRLAGSGKESYTVRLTPLAGEKAKAAPEPKAALRRKELSDPAARAEVFAEPRPLALLLEGKFPHKYQGLPPPPWKR